MRLISCLMIGMILVISFSSCQKEIDGRFEDLGNDSTYIKEIIVLDTLFPPTADTSLKYQLSYDGSKRLSKCIYTGYSAGTPAPAPITFKRELDYRYNGSNSSPDFIIDKYQDFLVPANNYTDSTYFTYYLGKISKDSTGPANDYLVTDILRLSNTRYKMLERAPDISGSGEYIDTTYSSVSWLSGNLVKETDSLWVPSPGFWNILETTLTYDNKPNPLKDLLLLYPNPVGANASQFPLEFLALPTTNNILSWVDDSGVYTVSYEYRANGLPKLARDSDGIKVIYKYTKL